MEPPDDPYLLQHEDEEEQSTSRFNKKGRMYMGVGSNNNRRNNFQIFQHSNNTRHPHRTEEEDTSSTPPAFYGGGGGGGESDGGMGDQQKTTNRTIPERVSGVFYSLGLFCSSHPYPVIFLAALAVIVSCFPLFSLPFLGNKPKEFVAPYENYTVPPGNGLDGDFPRWYRGPPVAYIQQIIVKSAITPWTSQMLLTDAFRGPLAQVFSVTELTKKYDRDNNAALPQLCFSVGEVKSKALKGKISMLPEFGCLIVSPADFWQRGYEKFKEDPDILSTILNYQSHQRGRSGLSEILLGMSVRDTGLKRFPLKPRPRVVSYAITIVLQKYDSRYIDGLRHTLTRLYPPHRSSQTAPSANRSEEDHKNEAVDDELNMIHVYYPSQASLVELFPLIFTYIAMFIYVYFSVKKIEMVTSKLGVAISALATVVASLCMSVGLCSHFGMVIAVNAKAIYPYLVVIIGLENILVLTRSVVSTSKNLDFKIRVAQGLSKEGWSITKNLLTEITILTIGFFTFIPAVQEFCILAIVGLLSDFFLQTFFFATVLSVDIQSFSPDSARDVKYAKVPLRTPIHPTDAGRPSGQRRNAQMQSDANGSLKKSQQGGISVVAPSHTSPILVKIPKRLRLIYFWARTRFFQRTFTIFMIGWISVIIYESGIVARFVHEPADVVLPPNQEGHATNLSQMPLALLHSHNGKPYGFSNNTEQMKSEIDNRLYRELYSHNPYIWRRLTPSHWQVLFGVYNISLAGNYVTILPSICISVPVQPEQAMKERHPQELQQAKRFNWQALANAFEAIDSSDIQESVTTASPISKSIRRGIISDDDPYVPSSPVELALTVLLAIPSLFFIGYLVVVLYRCICSRNYAEWRSSWSKANENPEDHYTQVVFEAVPVVLDGHSQEVECIATDGNIIASVCLTGTLKVWHVGNGDIVCTVDRQRYFEQLATVDKEDSYCTWVPSDADSPPCSPNGENVLIQDLERPSSANTMRAQHPLMSSSPPASRGIPIPQSTSTGFGSQVRSTPPMIHFTPPNMSQSFTNRTSESLTGSRTNLRHSRSNGDSLLDSDPCFPSLSEEASTNTIGETAETVLAEEVPAVWCLECQENLVFLGTGSGRLEIWNMLNGSLKSVYEDSNPSGIVCIKVVGNRILLARLNGWLDILEIEVGGRNLESPSPYHRWHSADPYPNESGRSGVIVGEDQDVRCNWLMTQKAHQQPITCLDCEGGRILTGSQDHTLKVFRLEDHLPLYTLHGHYGPITCLFIDKYSPMTSGSGSQDGMLCVWDLLTGMCMYSIQAHDGPVSSITYSASYIISVGGDDKICVWERFQGHLLNTIQLDHAYCSSLVMLTQNLLITSKQGSLIVWDVRSGQPVRAVRLGHRDNAVFVRQIISCADAVLCDYGSQLRLVRFPSVISKFD